MAIVVGIDEAGYGPVLGPLVVAAAVFEMPEAVAGQDFWKLLSAGVVGRGRGAGDRICICDSKQLHRGDDRLAKLERNVLATCPLSLPLAFHEFTEWLGMRGDHLGADEPWHREPFPPLPLAAEAESIARLRSRFQEALEDLGGGLRRVLVNLAQPWRFNRMVATTGNKAAVLWHLATELMDGVRNDCGGRPLDVTMDKHGGRTYYAQALRQAFPMAAVTTLVETAGQSGYRLEVSGSTVELRVLEKADGRSLPVALASMYAKYVREIFMAQFNRYWQERAADVAPTAGYWEDYQRWSKEMKPQLTRLELAPDRYIRTR